MKQFEEKKINKNVPFLLYLYISKYLLKYVILLILLTIKDFLNKKREHLPHLFSNVVQVVAAGASGFSVTPLQDLCNHCGQLQINPLLNPFRLTELPSPIQQSLVRVSGCVC